MRVINNLIILGRAFPQKLKDGRRSCCAAGWCEGMGFIRIYPTYWLSKKLKRWNVVNVNVEDDNGDWRKESHKIINSKDLKNMDEQIEVVEEYPKNKREKLIIDLHKTCPSILNNEKKSIGIVKPKILKTYFSENKKGKKVLKIKYVCEPNCIVKRGFHDSQVLEWGVYEGLRKVNNKQKIIDSLHLFDEEYNKYFLIGNGYHTPRSFMIISILRFKK